MMTQVLSIVLAQANAKAQNINFLIMMGLIMVIFYFFMIRPQQKKQKEIQKFRESLQKGDRVITAGGIYGKINDISDNVVTIEVEDKMRLKVDKGSIMKDPSDIQAKS